MFAVHLLLSHVWPCAILNTFPIRPDRILAIVHLMYILWPLGCPTPHCDSIRMSIGYKNLRRSKNYILQTFVDKAVLYGCSWKTQCWWSWSYGMNTRITDVSKAPFFASTASRIIDPASTLTMGRGATKVYAVYWNRINAMRANRSWKKKRM